MGIGGFDWWRRAGSAVTRTDVLFSVFSLLSWDVEGVDPRRSGFFADPRKLLISLVWSKVGPWGEKFFDISRVGRANESDRN